VSSTGWRAIASAYQSGDITISKRNKIQWPSSSSHFLRVKKAGRGTTRTNPPMHVMLRYPLIHVNTVVIDPPPDIRAHSSSCA
jgi:hypothetical protein